ncbi:hypothetical protein LIER_34057 [Lithospermum erythrorhizon]|uniref:Reverse transcriptase domain-containing protein n=1 Tax=Lithospermum erythrorhizon TaxID=34254 RepID=A0AAV3S224_LITER
MLLFWDVSRVLCEVLEVDSQHIHLQVRCKVTQVSFLVTFVYPVYCVTERRKLWDHLTLVGSSLTLPWIVAGDFNCHSSPNDKVGGVVLRPYDTKDLMNFRMALGLKDAPFMGSFFTWTNGSIWSKLDKVLINGVWGSLALTCSASFLPMEPMSDHCTVIISLVKNFANGTRPFKFMNMWLEHPSFDDVLRSVWDTWHEGITQFSLCSKLKALKAPLNSLNREEFGSIFEKAMEANVAFKDAVQAHMDDPLNDTLKSKCHELRERANFLLAAERSFISQKSRELFGSSREVQPIDREVVSNGYVLSTADGASLVSAVLDIEIREALFDIGNEKAPGPDGFSSAFFKSRWDLVGGDVTGVLLKNWNHMILALLPKVSGSPRVSDFRPIGLTNVLYKVITKILSRRLSIFLPKLIDEAQGAFVQGQNIVDNIWVAQELVRGYNRSRCTPSCMLMVDIRKAFDTVSWSFLEDVLRGFGLPELFIGWIMACVRNPTFSISFNGELHGYSEGKRGLRQGDPMSPALFLLCIEYLSRLLKAKTQGDRFRFHPRCEGFHITHLAFADDLMLFSYGDEASV